MKCRLFRDLLDEYMDNELNEIRREAMETHSRDCSECRGILRDRQILFHRLTEPVEPDWSFNLADSVMAEIRTMPLPHTANPMRKPLLIALLAAVVISGMLMIFGMSSLPESISPVDVFKLMAGSIDMPPGLRASVDELGGFLGACWVIVWTLIHVVIQIAMIVLFRIPVAIPLIIVSAGTVLGVWWLRRRQRGSSLFGILFSIVLFVMAPSVFSAQVGLPDSPTPEGISRGISIEIEDITDIDDDKIQILIESEVDRDGVTLFGSIHVAPDEIREGDVVIFGGRGTVEGRVMGSLVVFGGNADVSGHIEGDLVMFGGNLNLTSTAQIDGSLVNIGGNVNRDVGAFVYDTAEFGSESFCLHPGDFAPDLGFLQLSLVISILLTWLVVGFITILVFTRSVESTAIAVQVRPLQSLLAGFLFHVVILLACLLLTIIIVGIPLALLGGIIWLCISVFGTVVGFVLMGKLVMEKLGKGQMSVILLMLTGFIILAVIRFMPLFIGWTLWQLWAMAGIGATLLSRFGSNKPWFQPKSLPQKEFNTGNQSNLLVDRQEMQ